MVYVLHPIYCASAQLCVVHCRHDMQQHAGHQVWYAG